MSHRMFPLTGGTLDVTVHELLENGGIRELYKATGGTFGGQNVNRQFMILLETIFTKSFIDNYASGLALPNE